MPTSIALDNSGNVYVTGYSYGIGTEYDYATVNYNSSGIQQWVSRYNGSNDSTDISNSIAVDNTGNVYVTGKSLEDSALSLNYDCTTIKYSSGGSLLWKKKFHPQAGSEDEGKFIKINNAGFICVVGNFYNTNIIALRYNSSGGLLSQFVDFIGSDSMRTIITSFDIDNSNNFYISGSYNNKAKIVKFSTSCAFQWLRKFGGENGGDRTLTKVDNNANIYATTYMATNYQGIGVRDIELVKYNSSGVLQWSNTYGGSNYFEERPIDLVIDQSGNVYVTGKVNYTTSDIVTIKFNSSGIRQWVSRYINPSSGFAVDPVALGLDKFGNLFLAGTIYNIVTYEDYLLIKYPNNLQLNIKAAIEGYYDNVNNRLNVSDTITAYLKKSSPPYNTIDSSKAIVDTITFIGNFCFVKAESGKYYISLKNRSVIETWSKVLGEDILRGYPLNYDFTSSSSQAYGNNLKLKGSIYTIFCGDVNQDGIIDGTDLSMLDNDAYIFRTGIRLPTDLNGDNVVDGADFIIGDNNRNFITVIRP